MWVEDEAGPYQAIFQPGSAWQPAGQPTRLPHEDVRAGTAKLLTLFHPASGQVRVRGVTSCTNAVLHPWLQQTLSEVLQRLPVATVLPPADNRAVWERWQEGLSVKFTLLDTLPPLRMLLVLDNLVGHKTPDLVCWLMRHGIMPLYTPVAGSWLNMAESIQRILVRRALAGQSPTSPAQIIQWLEATARGCNAHPTPFVWGGKRRARRQRAYARRHPLGGSRATTLQVGQ
ncbi:transposase [Deinococcus hopiensis]|uniref:transposase n=1 Tax=Deinococcus hopiensis TaxID=309885 RepID=UPI0009FDDB4C|nr:transposase [Deinococcus hopiensis]